MTKRILLTFTLALLLLSAGCASQKGVKEMPFTETKTSFERPADAKNPQVTIEMESGAKIVLELYYDKAPNTVLSFVSLASNGFYDGLIFHRVIQNFMIQGGDPSGDGTGGPGYQIPGEFPNAGFTQNDLLHTAGTISMARRGHQDAEQDKAYHNTAGSQFFICEVDYSYLDGNYTPFGRVIEGMDEVKRIASVTTDQYDKPLKAEVMKKVTVDTFGVKYPAPVGTKAS